MCNILQKTGQVCQVSNEEKQAFIGYYNKHSVIPVSQDLRDIKDFVFRRNYLYSSLGIPLNQLKNKTILELGPGGAFNAVATSAYFPDLYVFVDATKVSLEEIERKRVTGLLKSRKIEIINSNIFDFYDERKFDCVIIEGVVPGQNQPEIILQHASSFVREDGILITTTNSAASILSEICRRLFRIRICEGVSDFSSKVNLTANYFESHLKALDTSTRTATDWVIDSIFHDWHTGKYIFTIPDSIVALDNSFDFYNSSPRFLTDDRWYKKINRSSESLNKLAVLQFSGLAGALLDYRVPLTTR